MYGLRSGLIAAIASAAFACGNTGFAQDFSVSGSTLRIVGDSDDETLVLTGGAPGEVIVTDGNGDEIDAFDGIRQIDIDLRGGEDVLTLSNLALDGGFISANVGLAGDAVFVTGLIDADLVLRGGGDADLMDLSGGTIVTGNLDIYGGVRSDDVILTGLVVTGDLWVDTQGGDDELLFDGLTVDGRTRIDLGAGDDDAGGTGATFNDDVVIIAGLGSDDLFNSANVFTGDLFVDLRGGNDDYEELGSTIDGDYDVDGGAGNDSFDDSGTVVLGSRSTKSV